ncbi:MAG: hypothetical protein JWN94_2872 [Betaproteobacteria bacterium]|nr:hypothetical protein [Betaproteobacteria bacterium]
MDVWHGSNDAAWDRAQEELFAAGVTDGLPVTPPTRERVEAMLAHCGIEGDQVIGMLPPAFGEVTWRDIAINAVMAGCLPAHLPVVGAAVDALAASEFNLIGVATTTGSAWPIIIVNGPIAAELGMNAEGNVLGPGNRANAVIGRAMNLALRNIGGALPGELDMATLGQPAKYTCCFPENESASPWAALHVERGFSKESNVVTIVGIAGSVEIVDSASNTPENLAQTFAQSMLIAGSAGGGGFGLLGGGEPLLLMPPEIANTFERGGCNKAQAKALIWERAVLPLDRLSPAVREHQRELRVAAEDGTVDGPLRIARKPDDVMIVVTGGVGIKAAYMPTWGGTTKAVSRLIRESR